MRSEWKTAVHAIIAAAIFCGAFLGVSLVHYGFNTPSIRHLEVSTDFHNRLVESRFPILSRLPVGNLLRLFDCLDLTARGYYPWFVNVSAVRAALVSLSTVIPYLLCLLWPAWACPRKFILVAVPSLCLAFLAVAVVILIQDLPRKPYAHFLLTFLLTHTARSLLALALIHPSGGRRRRR